MFETSDSIIKGVWFYDQKGNLICFVSAKEEYVYMTKENVKKALING